MADAILKWQDFGDEPVPVYHLSGNSFRPTVWAEFRTFWRINYSADSVPAHNQGVSQYRDYLRLYTWLFRREALPAHPDPMPEAQPFVNAGRWIVQCGNCLSGAPVAFNEPTICVQCQFAGWQMVIPPSGWQDIEAALLELPGHRLAAPERNWRPTA